MPQASKACTCSLSILSLCIRCNVECVTCRWVMHLHDLCSFLTLSCFENTSRAHNQMQTGAWCAFVSAVYSRILPVFTSMQILQVRYAPALWNLHLLAAWLYTITTPLLLVRVPNLLPGIRRATCLDSPHYSDLNSWHLRLFRKVCTPPPQCQSVQKQEYASTASPFITLSLSMPLPWPALLPQACQCQAVALLPVEVHLRHGRVEVEVQLKQTGGLLFTLLCLTSA